MTSAPRPSPAPRGSVVVHVFGRTDVGRTREHNEDAFVVADLTTDDASLQPRVRTHTIGDRGSLFMVADGMGGAAAGEIASAMATEVVLRELRSAWRTHPKPSPESFAGALKHATAVANREINAYATAHPEFRGMGTTATVAGLLNDTLFLAQVGDSRAYLVRDGVASQITKDQSLMQKLVEAGELTEEEAEHSERRNIILQALGPEATIKVDLTHQQVRRDDVLILCSDGLSGQVSRDDIARTVTEEPDLMAVCKRLIDLANEAGGPDNITVIAARFDGDGLTGVSAGDQVGHRIFPLAEAGQTPPMPMDRAIDDVSKTPTQPVRAVAWPSPPQPSASLNEPPVTPVVSPVRRGTGRAVAVLLLVGLIVAAAWFVIRLMARGAPATSGVPGVSLSGPRV